MNNTTAGAAPHRREEILRILREGGVRSQEELAHRLKSRGFVVAQPTLSRDLKDLSVVKTPQGYAVSEDASGMADPRRREERLTRALRELVVSVEVAGTLVVLRTPPAEAHPVARAIDEAGVAGVAGTIAGDDTIFLAAKSVAAATAVARRLLAPLEPRPATRPLRRAGA